MFRRPLQASILQVGTLSSEQGSICLEQVSWIRKENSALPSSPLAVQPLNKRTRWGRRPSSTPKCLGMGVMNGWKGGKEKREGGRRTVKGWLGEKGEKNNKKMKKGRKEGGSEGR